MPCNATSQLTNAPSVPLQVTMPTNNAQWAVFVQRLQDAINATRDAANRTGVNVVPTAYAVYNGTSLPALSINGANAALDNTKSQFGKASLKLTATASTVTVSFTGNPIAINAFQGWIESVYIQSSRASIAGTLAVVTPVASYPVDISGTLLPATWGRLYGDCSLVADASTQATLTLTLTGCSVGDTFNLEGWQLEQAAGNTNLPSAFVNSAAPGSQDTLPDGSSFVRLAGSHASGNVAYNYRGVWSSATAYVTGDEVVYSGSYWLCLTGNTNSAPAQGNGNWQVVGAYNNYQGAWSSTVTYYAGQETTYSGNYWVATATNVNSAPSTSNPNWVIAGPQNLDHVADGTDRFAVVNGGGLNAVSAVDPNKKALIDFTQAGHTGKSLANVPDDPGTARFAVANIDGNGRALIDFSQGAHLNKTQDYIPPGSSYGRAPLTYGSAYALSVPNADFSAPLDPQGDIPFLQMFGGSAQLVAGGPSGAAQYCLLTATATSNSTARGTTQFPLAGGDYISGSVWMWPDTAGTSTVAGVQLYNSSGGIVATFIATAQAGAGWLAYSFGGVAPAGTAYARTVFACGTGSAASSAGFSTIRVSINDVRFAGSGATIGDQRNLVSSITRNSGLVRSATALTANAGGSVNVNAHTITLGAASINYNAVTNAVTGLTTGAGYYIYTHDNYAGGTQTWSANGNANIVNSYDDAYNAGYVTIPSSGSSGGGGAGGGGGGTCVCADMYLRAGLTARGLAERWRWWKPWLWFLRGREGWHLIRRRPRVVQALCTRVTVADGSNIDCSVSTPITTQTGESVQAPMVYGRMMWTDSGWQRVIDCEFLRGERDVVRICVGGHSFLAGADPYRRLDTHNAWKP